MLGKTVHKLQKGPRYNQPPPWAARGALLALLYQDEEGKSLAGRHSTFTACSLHKLLPVKEKVPVKGLLASLWVGREHR